MRLLKSILKPVYSSAELRDNRRTIGMASLFDNKIFKAIKDDGTVVFNGQKAGFKERAFLCFYLL